MDLRLLSYFLAVCETGSLHAAASTVHVAQPSLSRQIRKLESTLGFVLFDRTARGLSLTAAGREFRPIAQDLVDRGTIAASMADVIARGGAVTLRAAAAPTTIADIVAPFVIHEGLAGPIHDVLEVPSDEVYGMLDAGAADIAIGTRVPPIHLSSIVLGNAFLWAQFPTTHPFASRTEVTIDELVAEPLIVVGRTHNVRRMFDEAVALSGLSFTPAIETDSPHMAQALAAAGRGVCILSDDSRFGLTTVPIRVVDRQLTITLFGAWDRLHYGSRTIRQCLGSLSAFIGELYPQTPATYASE